VVSRWAVVVGFVVSLAWAAVARAQDFGAEATDWTGLSGLVELARTERVTLIAPRSFDLADLRPNDAILIVGAERPLPVFGLQVFLRNGGRVAVAADYQRGGLDVLHWFRIETEDIPASGVDYERDNPNLAIAIPRTPHPLCTDVDGIVTNHARSVRHPRLQPVLGFAHEGPAALVLTGRVDAGRLVAIGDPSVLINNMLRFPGNPDSRATSSTTSRASPPRATAASC
jgi:hypothetical protein